MGDIEIPNWLNGLPLAPEYHPTDTEFADPIAYISKIEKEASSFGICKVIPPYPKPSKKFVFSNLNKSLFELSELGSNAVVCPLSQTGSGDKGNDGEIRAVFTTRHQELGHGLKRNKGPLPIQQSTIHKQVWESGEKYTLEQFESKSKTFARSQLGMIKEVSPLVVEALFWKAASEKPIYIEYANDVPGSGFGEPENPFRFIRKRRRKRKFNKKCQESSNCEKHEMGSLMDTHFDREKDVPLKNDSDPSNLCSDEGSRISRQKSLNAGSDKEGTAGWKLSNSPWNLQVISRSHGSLTRFMLDDIPGVTSPMIYIGMLFSWFAWHVEDHELHSLNFLHHGSPKTWYAAPGDYAFTFEEVIRSQGYGGNVDRLASLTLLGEKTNLLSPEIVVASGIPCCRLVQNPGEFVVTFPRAYHVGFSHGFNCGEAANFGTPQWLKVAKEAAVRRAAMNYLPMLSHQQLLYMLTMSFISRVPRALLPGARSSRLRDRQKEERELLVKKAFIDDMLNENNILSVLLGRRQSTFFAVLWDPESLPSPRKDSQSFPSATVDASCLLVEGGDLGICDSEKNTPHEDNVHNGTFNQTSSCREMSGDFYVDDDDLPCGLHVDSGTLACVACGILGFPFMTILQPSQRASEECFPADYLVVEEGSGVLKSVKPSTPSDLDDTITKPASDAQGDCDAIQKLKLFPKYDRPTPISVASNCERDVSLMDTYLEKSSTDAAISSPEVIETTEPKDSTSLQCHSADTLGPKGLQLHPTSKADMKWNTSNGFLRPRIFCLEHALEIEELLHSKGGANALIICHSAYPKIKAHALAVAEEVGVPFNCNDVSLEHASKEDLDLINISIDDEEECREDWTSRLGINLQYRVKLRKLSSLKQEQHVLALGGLFSDTTPDSDVSSLKWNSKRSRTLHKTSGPNQSKLSESTQVKKDDLLLGKPEKNMVDGETKLIHYLRRNRSRETGSPSQATSRSRGRPRKHLSNETCANGIISEDTLCSVEIAGNDSAELASFPAVENSEMQHEARTIGETRETSEASDHANFIGPLVVKNTGNNCVESANFPTVDDSEMQHEARTIGETRETSEASDHANFIGPLVVKNTGNNCVESANFPTVDDSEMQHEVCMTEETGEASSFSDLANSVGSLSIAAPMVTSFEAHRENQTMDEANNIDTHNKFVTVDGSKMREEVRTEDETSEMSKSSDPSKSLVFLDTVSSATRGSEVETENRTTEETCVENKACDNVMLDASEVQQENQTANGANEGTQVCNSAGLIGQILDTVILTAGGSEGQTEKRTTEETYMENKACDNVIPDASEVQQENQTANETIEEMIACNSVNLIGQSNLPASMVENSEEKEIQATEEATVDGEICSPAREPMDLENTDPISVDSKPTKRDRNKRKRELEQITEDQNSFNSFIKSPCEGLRPRTSRIEVVTKKVRNPPSVEVTCKVKKEKMNEAHVCNLEGCRMSFKTRAELQMHKRNRCTHEGCGKGFSSHRYAMLHQRVHADERPYKCSWKGCKMSFKWAWARTEHLRLHTGERPYQCKVEGCGLTFRFVSDFSRHRRKTGHYVNLPTS